MHTSTQTRLDRQFAKQTHNNTHLSCGYVRPRAHMAGSAPLLTLTAGRVIICFLPGANASRPAGPAANISRHGRYAIGARCGTPVTRTISIAPERMREARAETYTSVTQNPG